MRLYDWQTECLTKWSENQYRGIVNVVTGAGKTVFALAAVSALEQKVGDIKVKIIVPQTFLVRQWFHALSNVLGVHRKDIGIFAAHKSNPNKKFMIYVINSARYSFARHMLADANEPVLIIADECHHYGAAENAKIFDFARLTKNYGRYYSLGLSATPGYKNYQDILAPYLGNEIYRFGFVQALEAGIISQFSLFNIALNFSPAERNKYEELSENLSISLRKLKKYCPQLYVTNSRGFFFQLETIAKSDKCPEVRQLAKTVSLLAFQRKELVHLAGDRLECVVNLVRQLGERPKIIIFGERIEMADRIYARLNDLMPGQAVLYHSGVHESVRKIRLRNFEDSAVRILVSCKTLDEGLNVTDADIGIVVSSTSTERQKIQRLGRILRRKEGDSHARFYYLYVKDTMESSEVFNDIPPKLRELVSIVNLDYNAEAGTFSNAYYEELAKGAVAEARSSFWGDEEIAELIKNINLGAVNDDWLMDEKACLSKIQSSSCIREKNYYVAALKMVMAMNGGEVFSPRSS